VEDAADHRGLIEDACAMANTRGGWLHLGVTDNDGSVIAELQGIQFANADAFRPRLSQINAKFGHALDTEMFWPVVSGVSSTLDKTSRPRITRNKTS
jgi:predicted HTH transcriptional regulator